MSDWFIVILVFVGFFAAIVLFVFSLKRLGTMLRWEKGYSEIKASSKRTRESKTIAKIWGREEFYEDKGTHYNILSGHSRGISSVINFRETGILINPLNSVRYGIEYNDIDQAEIRALTGIGSWPFGYRLSIYSSNGIRDNIHLAVSDRSIALVRSVLKDKMIII